MKYQNRNNEIDSDCRNYLRQVNPGDAKLIIDFMKIVINETNYLLYGPGEYNYSLKEIKEYIASINMKENCNLIIAESENNIVGYSCLLGCEQKRIQHVCELGIIIKSNYWNKGIGSKLLEEQLFWAKNTKIIKKVIIKVHTENEIALALYRKYNFTEIGIIKNALKINDKYFNQMLMSIDI